MNDGEDVELSYSWAEDDLANQDLMEIVEEGIDVSTDDFYYDLFEGGYLKPEELLMWQGDIDKVKDAIEIIKKFKRSCQEQIIDFER